MTLLMRLIQWAGENKRLVLTTILPAAAAVLFGIISYFTLRLNVPAEHIAVLTKKTGDDLNNNELVAPDKTARISPTATSLPPKKTRKASCRKFCGPVAMP